MTSATARITSIDATRGVAVMGILLMNIAAFAGSLLAAPLMVRIGEPGPLDTPLWALSYLLVDSKMRGLFSMLFGASAALVIDAARAKGASGGWIHSQRMVVLLLFGVAHAFLVWGGDILTLYALVGFTLPWVSRWPAPKLLKGALVLLATSFLMTGVGSALALAADPRTAGAIRSLADPASATRAQELAAMLGTYADAVGWRSTMWSMPFDMLMFAGLETLGLMWLGMALYRSGLWRGEWDPRRERWLAWRLLAFGLLGNAALLGWQIVGGLTPERLMVASTAWSLPFDVATAAAYAIFLARWGRGGGRLVERVAATGRAAFSNYLGTSLLMLPLMGGWGLGWFGKLTRLEATFLALALCGLMLLWSKPWFDRFAYGPFEWLLRMMARGRWVPLRR